MRSPLLPRRPIARPLVASLAVLAIAGLATPVAHATPQAPQAPAALRGVEFSASADVGMATIDVPALSPAILPQTNVDLTRSIATADSAATPRTQATSATTGDSALLGQALDIQTVTATAPPSSADSATLLPLDLSPLANIPVITTTAAANWISDTECVASSDPLSAARAFVADADVVTPDPGTSVLSVDPSGGAAVDTRATTGLPVNGGPRDQRSVQATVVPEIASVNVLNGLAPGLDSLVTVEVQNDPFYTATASGLPGGAVVTGVDPILEVTIGGTSIGTINRNSLPPDAVLADLTLADLFTGGLLTDLLGDVFTALSLPIPPDALGDPIGAAVVQLLDTLQPIVRLSIPYSEVESADGTFASVTTDLLLVELLAPDLDELSPIDPVAVALRTLLEALGAAPGEPLASIELAPMTAQVTAPAGGLFCGDDTDPIELQKVHSGPAIPGATFDYTIAVGNTGECTFSPVHVVDTLLGPAGTTIVATEPPATVTPIDGGFSLDWADVGPIAPDGRTSLRIRVRVPENAQAGQRYTDTVTTTVGCDGEELTDTATLNEPTVERKPSGPCNLSGSAKGKSHLEVYPGESFIYFVNVYNGGGETCHNVTVTDPLDSHVSFESCSDGCSTAALPNVTWSLGDLPAGQSVTLRLQVKVKPDTPLGTELANTAQIDSDETQPVTVRVSGPVVSGNSVLSLGNPATTPNARLARTGGEATLALALGLGLAGWLVWQLRRRVTV